MKERGIIMSPPMAVATWEGRKTNTRRLVQGEALRGLEDGFDPPFVADPRNSLCPHGSPGDRLWVRENCQAVELADGTDVVFYPATGTHLRIEDSVAGAERWGDLLHYDRKRRPRGSVVPSIHMPRWASRMDLEVTRVEVQRLQDIGESDAKAEGLEWVSPTYGVAGIATSWNGDPVQAYRALWEHINGEGSWAANPWVWSIHFIVHRRAAAVPPTTQENLP